MTLLARQMLGYVVMPQIVPRCQALIRGGFGFVSYSMACVFQTTGLLPRNHPYSSPDNIGKFGLHHVLAQAAANLRFNWRNIDQIVLFALMLAGTVLLAVQIGVLAVSFFMQAAHAAVPTTFAGFFTVSTADAKNDIAYMLMDRVFGIPGMFGSCVSLGAACFMPPYQMPVSDGSFPFPYHTALHAVLGFYSQGLLFVAAIILIYHIVTLAADMAQTGHFFGQRFNRVWAPVRLVAAIGLLLPMASGLNSAQYLTLYIAKYGSGMASNAWTAYVGDITAPATLLGPTAILLSKPQYPAANELIQFLATAQTCWRAYFDFYGKDIEAYAVRESGAAAPTTSEVLDNFDLSHKSLYSIQDWYGKNKGNPSSDILIVFGEKDDNAPDYKKYKGHVRPFCGQLVLPTGRIADLGATPITHSITPTVGNTYTFKSKDGIDAISYRYLRELVTEPWYDVTTPLRFNQIAETAINWAVYNDHKVALPTSEDMQDLVDRFNNIVKTIVDDGYQTMTTAPVVDDVWAKEATQYGWGGAAIWYNRIAQLNGSFSQTVFDTPIIIKYPEVMEFIVTEKLKANAELSPETRFDPALSTGQDIQFENQWDKQVSLGLNQTYKLFKDTQDNVLIPATGNQFYDAINAVFKKTALWNFRKNSTIHPLANMVSLGKSLLANTVIAFGSAGAVGIAKMASGNSTVKKVGGVFVSLMVTVGYICGTAGILLYYIVPFLPFIYFMFAMLGWLRTIFEAIVGVPLWALAHLRYDGPGFPTGQSMFGYYILLDIFIRPILIIFGLIASTNIFYAVAKTLNQIFDQVVSNLTGFDPTNVTTIPANTVGSSMYQVGPVDELMYTIIYAVIVYMVAVSCFKMIDLFPNSILRWMNIHAQGYGSRHQDDPGETVSHHMRSGVHKAGGALSNAGSE